MALLKENINNFVTDDLNKRNQNWAAIDNSLELKADKTYVDSKDALKADKTYVDGKVKTDVPSGAKFTDTITTKTSELTNDSGFLTSVTKSDIGLSNVENLSAASIRSGTTKANVGLGNVDNVKQMPISDGVLENYREKLTTVSASGGSIDLSLGNVFVHTPSGNRTYSITNAVSGQAHSFTLIITQTATARTLTFPASVKWQGGEIPDLSTASKTYVLTFVSVNGGTTWLGMFGGEF